MNKYFISLLLLNPSLLFSAGNELAYQENPQHQVHPDHAFQAYLERRTRMLHVPIPNSAEINVLYITWQEDQVAMARHRERQARAQQLWQQEPPPQLPLHIRVIQNGAAICCLFILFCL